jgi:hypothetical protein
MPLESLHARREPRKQRIGASGGREFHVGETDFWRRHQTYFAAEGFGKQLVPQADAEIRAPECPEPGGDRRLFRHEPGVAIFLPDVHRPAHGNEEIEAGKIGDSVSARPATCSGRGADLR